jgi:hypothetical protein
VGILELIWHYTAAYAPRGDLGRIGPQRVPYALAKAIGWMGDPWKLLRAMVGAQWFDVCPEHGVRVHDWPDHADQTVKRSPAVAGTKDQQDSEKKKDKHWKGPGFSACYDTCKDIVLTGDTALLVTDASVTRHCLAAVAVSVAVSVAVADTDTKPLPAAPSAAPSPRESSPEEGVSGQGTTDTPPTPPKTHAEAWDRVREHVRAQIDSRRFATWLEPTSSRRVDRERRELVVAVPRQEALNWIRDNYAAHMTDGLNAIGLLGWTVRFEVDRSPPLPPSTGTWGATH